MINGIGKSIAGGIAAAQGSAGKAIAGSAPVGSAAKNAAAGGTVAALVGDGAPVDTDKVASIRAAIAEGRYAVDPGKIADAMLAQDMGL